MKRPTKHSLIGKWRIIEMELWDKDFLDMMEPVYIAFDGKAARHRHRFCNRRSSVCPLFLSLPLTAGGGRYFPVAVPVAARRIGQFEGSRSTPVVTPPACAWETCRPSRRGLLRQFYRTDY